MTISVLLGDLSDLQRAALGYLAPFEGGTRAGYEYHLKRFFDWCDANGIDPMKVERVHIGLYVNHLLEERGNRGSTVNTAFVPIKGFYKWAYLDELIDRDPVVHVRLPKNNYRKKYPLERDDLRDIRRAGRELGGRHWALAELLVVYGFRISEACGVRIENFQRVENGHRVLTLRRKGGKEETVPMPAPVAQALDACAGDRTEGFLLQTLDQRPERMNRATATGLLATIVRHTSIARPVNPHLVRATTITVGLEGWLDVREAQWLAGHEDPRTIARHYDLGRRNHDRHPSHVQSARLTAA